MAPVSSLTADRQVAVHAKRPQTGPHVVRIIKRAVEKLVRSFGYDLTRFDAGRDAFVVQSALLDAHAPVVFDVGAYHGDVTLRYRNLVPTAQIFSFEPFPPSFEILQARTSDDPNIRCYQLALSSRAGPALLHTYSKSATNSLLAADSLGSHFWGSQVFGDVDEIPIRTETVDQLCAELDIRTIDILKMDVQGGEYDTLLGGVRMLREQRIGQIYLELLTCQTYQGQRGVGEYLQFLDSHGYELVDFFYPVRSEYQLLQVDALFANGEIARNLRGT